MLKIVSAATNQNFNQAILLLFFFGKMSKGGATLCIGIDTWIKMLKIMSTALNQNSTKQIFFWKNEQRSDIFASCSRGVI
jgi:hypothetical protein